MVCKCLALNAVLLLSSTLGSLAFKHSNHQADINVGYCINGLARTFATPMIYKSIIKNLVKPYGGNPHIFASMTVEERVSGSKLHRGIPQKSPDVQKLERGLKHLEQVLGGAEDTEAGAAALHAMPGWAEDEKTANSFMTTQLQANLKKAFKAFKDLKRDSPTPVVVDLQSGDVSESVINDVIAATKCKGATKASLYPALIAQMVHLEQCWTMFTTYEKEKNITFDRLVYLRPDATWIAPVQPHTDETTWVKDGLVTNIGGGDWAAVGTRPAMYHWFNRLQWHKEKCIESGLPRQQALAAAVPVASALPGYFGGLGVNFKLVRMNVVVVRDSKDMDTAQHACGFSKYAWDKTGWNCLDSIYKEDGTPRDDESGKWW